MELYPDDKRVFELLSKLKNSNVTYPSDILAARREAYLKQVANVLGIGIGTGIKNFLKNSNNNARKGRDAGMINQSKGLLRKHLDGCTNPARGPNAR